MEYEYRFAVKNCRPAGSLATALCMARFASRLPRAQEKDKSTILDEVGHVTFILTPRLVPSCSSRPTLISRN